MKKNETFFIKQLKKILIDKNLNQKDLGKLLGVKQQMVSRWITGDYKPAFSSLEKISKVLDVPINYFMDENKEEKNNNNKESELIKILMKEIELLKEKMKRFEAELELIKTKNGNL